MTPEVIGAAVVGLIVGFLAAFMIRPKSQRTEVINEPAAAASRPEKPKQEPKLVAPVRNDAISLLATLQREARFIDIVKEPLSDYSDAQVGAAARDVLRDCGAVLDRMFKLEPVVDQEEGAVIEMPTGSESARYRIAGNASSDARSGALVHHGWQAKQCELPKWTGDKAAALIVAPAELEVK